MSATAERHPFFEVFRHRNYVMFMAGLGPHAISSWMYRVAVGWLAWELTKSSSWLGIVAFCDLFPVMVISPFAGVLADRIDRLKIARVAQLLNMLQAAVLAALTLTGHLTI